MESTRLKLENSHMISLRRNEITSMDLSTAPNRLFTRANRRRNQKRVPEILYISCGNLDFQSIYFVIRWPVVSLWPARAVSEREKCCDVFIGGNVYTAI